MTIIIGLSVLAGLYAVTPHVMHANSQFFNFLQLLGAGCVVGFGVMLLIGGVVLRGDKSARPIPGKMPAPPKVAPPMPALQYLTAARTYLNAAREQRSSAATTQTHNAELWNIELAIESLILMVESNVPKQEGSK